ncbi:hypothetical protein COTS27_01147 [Spirochaetota bacterium]|nr:hypothetical protein COTS27_01147 [Spirochaetota bacterium]
MKKRMLPTFLGLAIAALFVFNKSILLSHLMYIGAAYILYRELLKLTPQHNSPNTTSHPQAKFTKKFQYKLLLLGGVTLSVYAFLHAQLLYKTTPLGSQELALIKSFVLISLSHYQLTSAVILIITLALFLVIGYLVAITSHNHNKAPAPEQALEPPAFPMIFNTFLRSFHALVYSTFFLYSIVKIKYSYLFTPTLELTTAHSTTLLIMIWSMAWTYDSAAYIGGTVWGRRKLGLSVSPNKSWSGLWLGMSTVIVCFLIIYTIGKDSFLAELRTLWFIKTPWQFIVFTVIIAGAAQCGDLIASFFKRAAQVKDSGQLFGPHGGFLDRNDSAIFACTVFYYLLVVTKKL